jgi:hypothetical protein
LASSHDQYHEQSLCFGENEMYRHRAQDAQRAAQDARVAAQDVDSATLIGQAPRSPAEQSLGPDSVGAQYPRERLVIDIVPNTPVFTVNTFSVPFSSDG